MARKGATSKVTDVKVTWGLLSAVLGTQVTASAHGQGQCCKAALGGNPLRAESRCAAQRLQAGAQDEQMRAT